MAETGGVLLSRTPSWPGRPNDWARRRAMVRRHLARVTGEPIGPVRMGQMVDEVMASYSRYWAESLRLPHLSPAEIDAGMRYDGFEHLAAARSAGRGTIIALPHLGGWEWAGTHLTTLGLPVSVVVEKLEPPDLFDWFVSFRSRLGMNVIPAGPGAAARCARALADNHVLCLLCDRLVEGTSGVEVEFFGERTELPAGPATLALRSGAALVPAAVYFEARTDAHLGVVLRPMDVRRSAEGRLRGDVQRVTQDLARVLERLIRREPTQWHLLQPNWPSDADAGRPE
jgi:lauroyl/myristoyl acyltransferase